MSLPFPSPPAQYRGIRRQLVLSIVILVDSWVCLHPDCAHASAHRRHRIANSWKGQAASMRQHFRTKIHTRSTPRIFRLDSLDVYVEYRNKWIPLPGRMWKEYIDSRTTTPFLKFAWIRWDWASVFRLLGTRRHNAWLAAVDDMIITTIAHLDVLEYMSNNIQALRSLVLVEQTVLQIVNLLRAWSDTTTPQSQKMFSKFLSFCVVGIWQHHGTNNHFKVLMTDLCDELKDSSNDEKRITYSKSLYLLLQNHVKTVRLFQMKPEVFEGLFAQHLDTLENDAVDAVRNNAGETKRILVELMD